MLLVSLIASGCNLSTNEVPTEPCVKNPFLNIVDDISSSNLEIGYFAEKSFYLIGADGKDSTRLTNGIYPYWSPDKQKIFYTEENEICIADSDGNHILQITNDKRLKSDIVWSPSGKYIAFTVYHEDEQDNGDIYIATVDGEITRLTNSPASSDSNPSWSPDEKMIAFDSYSDPVDTGGYIEYTISISVVDLANGKSTILTTDGFEPIWFSDGKQLLFESVDDRICKIDLEGQPPSCITSGYDDYAPQFSSDGKFIAFTRINKDYSIYIMKPDGSEQTKLVNGIYPIWSPDGSQIAFSTGGDHPDIYVINADGTKLTHIAKNAWGYAWVQP
jgi:Tol biopolymer transport system component